MRPLVLVPVVLVDPAQYQNLLNSHNSAVSGYYQVIQERDAISQSYQQTIQKVAYESSVAQHQLMNATQRALFERDQAIIQLAQVTNKIALDPNRPDQHGHYPLHQACAYGDFARVRRLLDEGAMVNIIDANSMTPLHIFSCLAHIPSFEANIEFISTLIDTLPIQQRVSYLNTQEGNNGFTSLHYAAAGNRVSLVQSLISLGANPNIPDHYGRTALNVAQYFGHIGVTELLAPPPAPVIQEQKEQEEIDLKQKVDEMVMPPQTVTAIDRDQRKADKKLRREQEKEKKLLEKASVTSVIEPMDLVKAVKEVVTTADNSSTKPAVFVEEVEKVAAEKVVVTAAEPILTTPKQAVVTKKNSKKKSAPSSSFEPKKQTADDIFLEQAFKEAQAVREQEEKLAVLPAIAPKQIVEVIEPQIDYSALFIEHCSYVRLDEAKDVLDEHPEVITATNQNGFNLFHCCAIQNFEGSTAFARDIIEELGTELVAPLIRQPNTFNLRPYDLCCNHMVNMVGNADLLKVFLEKGLLNPNEVHSSSRKTLLETVVYAGYHKAAAILIEGGADYRALIPRIKELNGNAVPETIRDAIKERIIRDTTTGSLASASANPVVAKTISQDSPTQS